MTALATALFDYDLPPRLIAQVPVERRDHSRLLVVDRASRSVAHHTFEALPEFTRPGDLLLRNNAAVLPARLHASRPTGGAVECLLLRPDAASEDGAESWWCLLRPGRRLPVGARFGREELFTGTVQAKRSDGLARVGFTTRNGEPITAVARRVGEMPLPPYIVRQRGDALQRQADLERYQTVYADPAQTVAVAAPTAGLHFTPATLDALARRGVESVDITLHVGLGTFRPITAVTVDEHQIHREVYELSPAAQSALLARRRRRIAVGTTTVRAAEDFLASGEAAGALPRVAEAALFIRPPFRFHGVDALVTNFHQPRSTLLCLVAAFLAPGSTEGIAWLKDIYAEAVAREYRFLSYGDAMLIL